MTLLSIFAQEHKVLLSGTPLQNNVEELFSLLNFLEPSQFASSEAFMVEFGQLHTEEQVDKLKAVSKTPFSRFFSAVYLHEVWRQVVQMSEIVAVINACHVCFFVF